MSLSSTAQVLCRIPNFEETGLPQLSSFGISGRFQPLSPGKRQVTHVLLTLSPLNNNKLLFRATCMPHPRRQHSI